MVQTSMFWSCRWSQPEILNQARGRQYWHYLFFHSAATVEAESKVSPFATQYSELYADRGDNEVEEISTGSDSDYSK